MAATTSETIVRSKPSTRGCRNNPASPCLTERSTALQPRLHDRLSSIELCVGSVLRAVKPQTAICRDEERNAARLPAARIVLHAVSQCFGDCFAARPRYKASTTISKSLKPTIRGRTVGRSRRTWRREAKDWAAGAVNGKVYGYDPAPNTWSPETAMPTARDGLTAAVANGVLFAAGGSAGNGSFNTVEAFTPY